MRLSKYLLMLTTTIFASALFVVGADPVAPMDPAGTVPPATAPAQPPAPAMPPPQTTGGASATGAGASQSTGRVRLSGTLGIGHAFNQDYTILGLGAGYYWWRGLETGVDFEGWFFNSPNIYKISPEARYMFKEFRFPIKPYVGGFYRHTFYEDVSDLDSFGGRVGGVLASKSGVSLGAGGVYETFMDCDPGIYGDCDQWYPEFTVFFSF